MHIGSAGAVASSGAAAAGAAGDGAELETELRATGAEEEEAGASVVDLSASKGPIDLAKSAAVRSVRGSTWTESSPTPAVTDRSRRWCAETKSGAVRCTCVTTKLTAVSVAELRLPEKKTGLLARG